MAVTKAAGGRAGAAVGRGVAALAAGGALLGGLAGTVDWPLVLTFFGAVEGAVAGAVVGLVVGLVLGRSPVSRSRARAISGSVALLAALTGAVAYRGPLEVPPAAAAVLVALSGLAGVAVGPLIAEGPACALGPERSAALMRFATRASTVALIGGSALGAAAGLVVGAFAYLPTAPFAAVEGAVLGVVAAGVLALAVLAVGATPMLLRNRP
jgi:hypothetical protein